MIVMRKIICVFIALEILLTTTAMTGRCAKFRTKRKNVNLLRPKLHECNCEDVNLLRKREATRLTDSPKYLSLSKVKGDRIYYEPVKDDEKPEFQRYLNELDEPIFGNYPVENITSPPKRETALKSSTKNIRKPKDIQNRENNDISEKQIEFDPTYIDIDFLEAGSIESMVRNYGNENSKETEHELVECLDLHIILHAKQTKNFKALRQLWKTNKIFKYLHVNDSDVINEIEIKCNKTDKIMQKSLEEIIEMIPKKENFDTPKYDVKIIIDTVINSSFEQYDHEQQQNSDTVNATTGFNFVNGVDSLETLNEVNENKNVEPDLTDNKIMYKTPYKATVNTRSTLNSSTEDTTTENYKEINRVHGDNIADMSSDTERYTETTINENIDDSYYKDVNYTKVISQNNDTILVVDKEGTSIDNFVEPFIATTLTYETLTVTNSPLHNNTKYLENYTKSNDNKDFDSDNDYNVNDILEKPYIFRELLNETELYLETSRNIDTESPDIAIRDVNNITKSNAEKGFDNDNDYNNFMTNFFKITSDIDVLLNETTTDLYSETTSNIESDSTDIVIQNVSNITKMDTNKSIDNDHDYNNHVNDFLKIASDIAMLINETSTEIYLENTSYIGSDSPIIQEVKNITKNNACKGYYSNNDCNNNYTNEFLESTSTIGMLINETTTEVYLERTSNLRSEYPTLGLREVNDVNNENELTGDKLTINSKNISNIISSSLISNDLLLTTTTPRTDNNITKATLDISGQLYFLFDSNYIPARFVQKSNGEIHLGLDGSSFCNKLLKNTANDSLLIRSMCNCTESGKKFN